MRLVGARENKSINVLGHELVVADDRIGVHGARASKKHESRMHVDVKRM